MRLAKGALLVLVLLVVIKNVGMSLLRPYGKTSVVHNRPSLRRYTWLLLLLLRLEAKLAELQKAQDGSSCRLQTMSCVSVLLLPGPTGANL